MTEPVLEQRVESLEDLMADLVRVTAQTQYEMRAGREASERAFQAHREASERAFQAHREASERDMAAFKEEMRAGREASERAFQAHREASERDMAAFKEENRAHREASGRDMAAFKEENRAHREASERDMTAFQKEMHQSRIEMRRMWGELSNRLGTMAEDLVAPSVPRILRSVVGCPDEVVDTIAVRVRKQLRTDPSRAREFDVVAMCGDYVLINETKGRLAPEDVKPFVDRLATVREFFPEFAGKRVIGAIASLYVDESLVGAIASLYVDESLVRYAEKQGLIVLGFGEDVMDVLNSPGFEPREF